MIKLCQYLCPQRHCIVGLAYHTKDFTEEDVNKMLMDTMSKMGIHQKCGICDSKDLKFEHRETEFKTIEEANSALRPVEALNILSRIAIDQEKFRCN